MAPRTQRKQHEEGEQETVSFAEAAQFPGEQELEPTYWTVAVHSRLDTLVNHTEKIERTVAYLESVLNPLTVPQEDNPERPKVQRRRSLDDMQFALKRLASGEPRPADDDSPQVLQDAINEVIALRMAMNKLIQASSNVYQNGLVAIRNLTAQ